MSIDDKFDFWCAKRKALLQQIFDFKSDHEDLNKQKTRALLLELRDRLTEARDFRAQQSKNQKQPKGKSAVQISNSGKEIVRTAYKNKQSGTEPQNDLAEQFYCNPMNILMMIYCQKQPFQLNNKGDNRPDGYDLTYYRYA